MYKLICFDLDDTLWPCMPTIQYAEQSIYDWLESNRPEITRRYTLEDLRDKRKQLMLLQPELKHDLSEARRAHLRELAEEFGYGDDWIEPAFQVFYQARQQVTLYEDVIPVLAELRTRYTLVALTNGNAHIRHTGLSDYFEFQVSAADVHEAKPHPAMFERAMAQAGVSPRQTLHVGDHPLHDVKGARNAGVDVAWLRRNRQPWDLEEAEPEFQFEDLFAFSEWLRGRGLSD